MTGIFGILESSATQRYQDVAPTQEFFFHRPIYSRWAHGHSLRFPNFSNRKNAEELERAFVSQIALDFSVGLPSTGKFELPSHDLPSIMKRGSSTLSTFFTFDHAKLNATRSSKHVHGQAVLPTRTHESWYLIPVHGRHDLFLGWMHASDVLTCQRLNRRLVQSRGTLEKLQRLRELVLEQTLMTEFYQIVWVVWVKLSCPLSESVCLVQNVRVTTTLPGKYSNSTSQFFQVSGMSRMIPRSWDVPTRRANSCAFVRNIGPFFGSKRSMSLKKFLIAAAPPSYSPSWQSLYKTLTLLASRHESSNDNALQNAFDHSRFVMDC